MIEVARSSADDALSRISCAASSCVARSVAFTGVSVTARQRHAGSCCRVRPTR